MDLNKLTIKSQEALAAAQKLATESNHQAIAPEHLFRALMSQPDGVVFGLMQTLGAQPRMVINRLEDLLSRIPKVYLTGADARISPDLSRVLDRAFKEAEQLKDDYVSAEHLLLALVETAPVLAPVFTEFGITRDAILRALVEVRGSQRVSSQNPEETYQALEKDRKSVV
jgi:ATP-dependent Clp protease ATP-binding subunit ClpB